MSFLQPMLLAGLPLAALPVVIHLLNRQRHRTVPWAAMMFLLDAKRMTRGMARLRYLLILAMRVLAVACLILAVSRPLGGGWLGLAMGGQPETTILILDRSASMEQQDLQTGQSKRSTGLHRLSELLRSLGTNTRLVLIENTANRAETIESAAALEQLPQTSASATSADIPAMLQTALEYIVANQTGRTDIWICSDLRASDWNAEDGRWKSVRDGFERIKGVRFNLLCYPQEPGHNLTAWVSDTRQRQLDEGTELILDIVVRRQPDSTKPAIVPLEIAINGARSVVDVKMTRGEHVLQGHTITLDEAAANGWGRVQLPADDNPQDNVFYFVFSEPPAYRTVVVSEDPHIAELLQAAAAAPAQPGLSYSVAALTPENAHTIDWTTTTLILWQAPLPDRLVAPQLEAFLDRGGAVICFPPRQGETGRFLGVGWGQWKQSEVPPPVAWWRGDGDLLGHTQSNTPLPVGDLRLYQYCPITGPGTVLARLEGGTPWLLRATTRSGFLYYCATLPDADHSSLAQQGVVFYVMIQRALAVGAAAHANARQLTAGSSTARSAADWKVLAQSPDDVISSSRPFHAGVFRAGKQLIALNRPASEDRVTTLEPAAVRDLFQGLDYQQIEDRVGNVAALASEVWQAFLLAMLVALLAEAWLCMPEPRSVDKEAAIR